MSPTLGQLQWTRTYTTRKQGWWGYGETRTLVHVGGKANQRAATLENSVEGSQNVRNTATPWFTDPSSAYTHRSKSRDTNRYLHTHIHSSITHNSGKMGTTQESSGNEWTNQTWVIHGMEQYWVFQSKESWHLLQHGWNLEDTVPGEVSQSQRVQLRSSPTCRSFSL